jgi:hypothetical protein
MIMRQVHLSRVPSQTGERTVPFIMASEERMSVEELVAEALKLAPEERERLAMTLLSSVGSRLEFEAEWIEEVERRAREIDEGVVETIPGDQVIREALDRLK